MHLQMRTIYNNIYNKHTFSNDLKFDLWEYKPFLVVVDLDNDTSTDTHTDAKKWVTILIFIKA